MLQTGRRRGGDQALVEQARSGDLQALDRLLSRYRAELLEFCLRGVNHRADAEDLVQEILLRAHRGLRAFRGRASFATWLYRIARNELWRYYRNKELDTRLELGGLLDETAALPEPSAADRGWRSLAQELARLARGVCTPEEYRVLALVWQGWEPSEIAALLRSSPSTIRSKVHRARAKALAKVYQDAVDLVGGAAAVRSAFQEAKACRDQRFRLSAPEARIFSARVFGAEAHPEAEELFRRACLKVSRHLRLEL